MENKLKLIDRQVKEIEKEIDGLQLKKWNLLKLKDKISKDKQEERSEQLSNQNWESKNYSWSKELTESLKTNFKITNFRPYQLAAINASMSGVDTILIMPTGGGKSLCFQLPAIISNGITLVVSPLISLMEDQVMNLKQFGIDAKMMSANSSKLEVDSINKAMLDPNSKVKLLYVTPEKLAKSKRFMSKLQKMHQMGRFTRLAIDEVHCCSQWGHDFRPDYKFLGIMRQMFSGTPILGLTATATKKVVEDVQKILNIPGCLVLKSSFNRPNLFYEVRQKPTSLEECSKGLAKLLDGEFRNQSGIIYTMTVKDTNDLATSLRSLGLQVAPYHGNLEPDVRSKIHRKWIENKYQAVVATIAFGMGIDKPDVKFVIHHCISKSMENFYQESGRAGRDDKPAKCILYWRFGDFSRQSSMVFTETTGLENLYGLIGYCLDTYRCRRSLIAEHFDERWESTHCDRMCDNCLKRSDICATKEMDLSAYGKQILDILNHASNMDTRMTGLKVIDAWTNKGSTKLRLKNSITSINREKAESIVAHLIVDGFLKEDFHFTPYSTISYLIPGEKAEAGVSPSPIIVPSKEVVLKSSLNDQNIKTKNGREANQNSKTRESSIKVIDRVRKHSNSDKSELNAVKKIKVEKKSHKSSDRSDKVKDKSVELSEVSKNSEICETAHKNSAISDYISSNKSCSKSSDKNISKTADKSSINTSNSNIKNSSRSEKYEQNIKSKSSNQICDKDIKVSDNSD